MQEARAETAPADALVRAQSCRPQSMRRSRHLQREAGRLRRKSLRGEKHGKSGGGRSTGLQHDAVEEHLCKTYVGDRRPIFTCRGCLRVWARPPGDGGPGADARAPQASDPGTARARWDTREGRRRPVVRLPDESSFDRDLLADAAERGASAPGGCDEPADGVACGVAGKRPNLGQCRPPCEGRGLRHWVRVSTRGRVHGRWKSVAMPRALGVPQPPLTEVAVAHVSKARLHDRCLDAAWKACTAPLRSGTRRGPPPPPPRHRGPPNSNRGRRTVGSRNPSWRRGPKTFSRLVRWTSHRARYRRGRR